MDGDHLLPWVVTTDLLLLLLAGVATLFTSRRCARSKLELEKGASFFDR